MTIETEEQYEETLSQIYDLMQKDLADGSDELNQLDELAKQVEAYEDIHYPIPPVETK